MTARLRSAPATGLLSCAMLVAWAAPLGAQIEVDALVDKDELTRSVPAGGRFEEPLELVRATTGHLTTMRSRYENGELRGAVQESREVFIALHRRASVEGEVYDRGVAAARMPDRRFRVLLVADYELGYVERLETLAPPGEGSSAVALLHVRYAQTGSGGVTEDRLFALDEDDELVDVPLARADVGDLLQDGEYLCCSRFTTFDEHLVELTVYVTRSGRAGVTDRARVRYELEGRFRRDSGERRYVPSFSLRVAGVSEREPVP